MSIALYNSLIVLATLVGYYLVGATVFALVISVGVACNVRKKLTNLTWLQWLVVPLIFLYHGYKHGLQWPKYWWEDHKRTVETKRYIRDTARRPGVT